MNRVQRGDVTVDPVEKATTDLWRISKEENLKHFVREIALDKNEFPDDYMKKHSDMITGRLQLLERDQSDCSYLLV